MPLYDCMLLLKPHVRKEALMDLMTKVGKHVYRRNGVLTDMKSFGAVQLGYGIKKLDGRYYQMKQQGQLIQMTMMTPPSFNNELHYLNKEDRLLRWLLVKHRGIKFEPDLWSNDESTEQDDPMRGDFRNYRIKLDELKEDGGSESFKWGSSEEENDDDDDDYEEHEGDGKNA